jgi:dipeptidyl aminopeptidase/acylaminoacyl peptidase
VSERPTPRDFEDDVRRAMRSYAEEGARAFDPGRISAQARSAGAGVRWLPGRTSPLVGLPGLRFALLLVLLGVSLAALAVVGSRLVTPPAPVPGLLAVAVMDQVLVVDPSSGTSEEITDPTPHDASPVWSPDGTRLALSQHDGRGTLQLIDADGGNRHSIVDDLTSGYPVAWSPDGSRIAFAGYHYPGGDKPGLYIVDADGTSLTLLVPGTGAWGIGRLSWSPDGSTIAFAAAAEAQDDPILRGYVDVVDVASGDVSIVSASHVRVEQDTALAWRPGGMELLYARQDKQSGELGPEDIVLAERVGDAWQERPLVTDLSPNAVTHAMWLDGDTFVYARYSRLWAANLDGRPELPIGEPGLDLTGPGCVAPDGSAVAVPVADGGTPEEPKNALLLVPTDGGPTIRTTTGWLDPSGPACSWQAVGP